MRTVTDLEYALAAEHYLSAHGGEHVLTNSRATEVDAAAAHFRTVLGLPQLRPNREDRATNPNSISHNRPRS